MHHDEYRDAYDHPRPARVPRLGRREPGEVPEVTPDADRAGEGRIELARAWEAGYVASQLGDSSANPYLDQPRFPEYVPPLPCQHETRIDERTLVGVQHTTCADCGADLTEETSS